MKKPKSFAHLLLILLSSCISVLHAQTPAISNFQTPALVITGYTIASSVNAASQFTLNLAVDSTGSITGNGSVRSFGAKSKSSTTSSFTILAESKIATPIDSSATTTETGDDWTSTSSEHSVDCIISTSSKVEIKGRLTYRYMKTVESSGSIVDESELSFVGAGFTSSKPKEVGAFAGGAIPSNPL